MLFRTCLVLMLLPATASAQALGGVREPRSDVSAGLSFLSESDVFWKGLEVAGALRVSRRVSLVGDLTFYDQSGLPNWRPRQPTWAGGVRVSSTAPKVQAFGQFLMGTTPFAELAMFPGLGVDVDLGRRTAFRGVFDVKISGDERWFFGGRVSVGLVMKVG